MDASPDYLGVYLLVIPVAAAVFVLVAATSIVLAMLVGLIVTTVLRALNPSHPISPHEEID
jgi:hypothetical protein